MHGGNIWALARERSLHPAQVLDFSADLNPMGPPAEVRTLLEEGLKVLAHYPDPDYRQFCESAAQAEGLDPPCILPGNGTADLIHLIGRWKAGEPVGVAAPTFTEYQQASAANSSATRFLPLREDFGFQPDPDEMLALLKEVRLFYLCNPNNPTGILWPAPLLRNLLEEAGWSGTTVVIDEAYMDFVAYPDRFSAAQWVETFPNLIVLRSLTKILALPGLRIGYLAASPAVRKGLNALQPPWALNGLAAWVGKEWIGKEAYEVFVQQTREKVKLFRAEFATGLAGFSELQAFPSAANFFLCRLAPGHSASDLARRLAGQGVLIRMCDDFTGLEPGRFVRLAVRTSQENQRFLRLLQEIFAHVG